MTLTARLGTLTFQGTKAHQVGFNIDPDGFRGWNDGIDMVRDDQQRPVAHGKFDLPGYLTDRLIIIEGECIAKSEDQLGHMRSQFTGLLADGGSGRIVVEELGTTLWADVRRASSRPVFEPYGGQPFARFKLTLWAADPRKYGETRTFPAAAGVTVSVHHFGNFDASPVITITGSSSGGYTITGPDGKTIVVTRPLVAGSPHRYDMATGLLYVNGVLVTGGLGAVSRFNIPGGATIPMSVSAGSMSVAVTDTIV